MADPRIDRAFRDRAPRIERIDGGDHVVVEADQILSGIGLISNAGARFEAPETISAQGRFEDVHRGGYDPAQHLKDMALNGVGGEVLYPSQGLFYFKVAEPLLMSAIFRAYNDWLAEFCRTDPARLKGIAMINLDDVEDGLRELERAARLGLSGAMITEYPAEDRRYDGSEYEPFWAAAAALDMPLSLHTATRRQGKIRGAGPGTLRDASSRATKAFYPALSMCDLIFSGVFERHPRLRVAIVEFELAWAPHLLSTMDYTYRERHGEAIYRFKSLPSRRRGACPREGGGGMLPSDFLPPQRRAELPGGSHRHSPARRHRPRQHDVGQHDVGLGLSAQRVDISPIAQDPGGDPRGRAGGRTGQACPGPRSGDRRRQHRPRVQF
jgi:amidohydrolase family protein